MVSIQGNTANVTCVLQPEVGLSGAQLPVTMGCCSSADITKASPLVRQYEVQRLVVLFVLTFL